MRLGRLAACTSGAAAVEFAIVSGVLILLLIGIVDLGRVLYVKNQISFLADRAVRRVLIQPDISGSELEAEFRDEFSGGDPASLDIEVLAQSAGGTEYRVITVDFPLTLFIPYLDSDSLSLSVARRVPTG